MAIERIVPQDLLKLSNEQLGELLRAYLAYADHGDWEGFSGNEQAAVHVFLRDVELFRRAREIGERF